MVYVNLLPSTVIVTAILVSRGETARTAISESEMISSMIFGFTEMTQSVGNADVTASVLPRSFAYGSITRMQLLKKSNKRIAFSSGIISFSKMHMALSKSTDRAEVFFIRRYVSRSSLLSICCGMEIVLSKTFCSASSSFVASAYKFSASCISDKRLVATMRRAVISENLRCKRLPVR